MKTPMRQLLDWLDQYFKNPEGHSQESVAQNLGVFLRLERNEIVRAVNFGGEYDEQWNKIGLQYYHERYGTSAVLDVCDSFGSDNTSHGICASIHEQDSTEYLCQCCTKCRQKCLEHSK